MGHFYHSLEMFIYARMHLLWWEQSQQGLWCSKEMGNMQLAFH